MTAQFKDFKVPLNTLWSLEPGRGDTLRYLKTRMRHNSCFILGRAAKRVVFGLLSHIAAVVVVNA